jgi:hypothetical protein
VRLILRLDADSVFRAITRVLDSLILYCPLKCPVYDSVKVLSLLFQFFTEKLYISWFSFPFLTIADTGVKISHQYCEYVP